MTRLAQIPAAYGRTGRDAFESTRIRDAVGARAVLETFYRAFNAGDVNGLLDLWCDDAVELDDPLGGIVRGREEIAQLYRSRVRGNGVTWIQFDDVLEISTSESVVFSGRERGFVATTDDIVPVRIRMTHCVAWIDSASAWQIVHQHGSIDDPELLARHQRAAGFRRKPGESAGANGAARL